MQVRQHQGRPHRDRDQWDGLAQVVTVLTNAPITDCVFALRMIAAAAVLQDPVRSAGRWRPVVSRTLPQIGSYRFAVVAINAVGTSNRSARSNLVADR